MNKVKNFGSEKSSALVRYIDHTLRQYQILCTQLPIEKKI